MATTKVSALAETTSPQANDELLINQSGVSKKVKITNLPAGLDNTKLPLAGGQMTGNITMSGSQTVDGRDISADGTQLDTNTSAIATKAPIASPTFTGTVAIPNIGNLEAAVAANTAKTGITTSQANAITANTAKVTNATHSGEVTGATALTIADNVVDEANLKVSNTPTNGYFLSAQSGNTGGMTWAEVDALPSQSGNSGKYLTTNGSAASWAVLDTDANTTTKGLYEHAHTIAANYSITSGNNAMTAGPITINSSVSVTIPSGSTWVIA